MSTYKYCNTPVHLTSKKVHLTSKTCQLDCVVLLEFKIKSRNNHTQKIDEERNNNRHTIY